MIRGKKSREMTIGKKSIKMTRGKKSIEISRGFEAKGKLRIPGGV